MANCCCTGIHTAAITASASQGTKMTQNAAAFPEAYNSGINFNTISFREFANRAIIPNLHSEGLRNAWQQFVNVQYISPPGDKDAGYTGKAPEECAGLAMGDIDEGYNGKVWTLE
jgi:hypothetical protein